MITLACFDAARLDHSHAVIYAAAATKLNAIWIRDEPLEVNESRLVAGLDN